MLSIWLEQLFPSISYELKSVMGGFAFELKSVMSGFDSYFQATLPSSLKIPHLSPDKTHQNLAF